MDNLYNIFLRKNNVVDKLQKLSAENQKIIVKKGSKITSLADEYIKSNNIQLEYE